MTDLSAVTTRVEAPPGGPPRFFALTPLGDGTLLAGTCVRGMVRSIDGGATWAPPRTPPRTFEIFSFMPGDDAVLATTGFGVWRSVDGGDAWEPLGLHEFVVYAVVDRTDGLLAGTQDHGLMASADGGRSWVAAAPELADRSVYRLLVLDDGGLLAATDAGVWRVRSDGAGYRATPSGLDGQIVYSLARAGEGVLLAGTRGDGVARSDDGGATWRRDDGGLPDQVVACLHIDQASAFAATGLGVGVSADGGRSWKAHGSGVESYRIFSLAAHPRLGLVAGSYDTVWALPPGGTSWSKVDTGLVRDANSMSLDTTGSLFAGAYEGLVRSDDGGESWSFAGEGLGAARVQRVIRLASGDLLAATDDGVFRAVEGSADWRRTGLEGRWIRCVRELAADLVLAGALGTGLHRSEDGGRTWSPVATGFSSPYVFDVLKTTRGTVFLATGDPTGHAKTGAVLRSDDDGDTWTCASDAPLTSYRAVESPSGTVFVGGQRSKVLRCRDGGAAWDLLDTTGLIEAKLWALTLDTDGRLLLGTAKGLLVSTDEAESWTMLDEGLDGVTVYDVRAHPAGALVAATNVGILRSVDGGTSWA